jgi:hypothetical protein
MADDPTCTNCGRPLGEHPRSARFAYCPSDYNDGDDDMTFSDLPPIRQSLFERMADAQRLSPQPVPNFRRR